MPPGSAHARRAVPHGHGDLRRDRELGRARGSVHHHHDGRVDDRATANGHPSDDRRNDVDLGTGGTGTATIWTCDLSAEYVRINGEYRT